MKGYKAFNKDLTCRGFQYEIGKEYKIDEEPIPCKRGFHFCKAIGNCYDYYVTSEDTRICEVESLGEVKTDDDQKYCTNHIRIIKEITKDWARKGNSNSSNSGYRNSGDYNSGDYNSGDYNSGDYNSGYRNSGYRNSGYRNSGDYNSGDYNSGYRNSGYSNSGYSNSGDYNSGDWNSGDWNSGYSNSGVFNSDVPTLRMFNQDSDWTFEKWRGSHAHAVMSRCPYSHSTFTYQSDMTEEERTNHPEYKTIGGYVKTITVNDKDKQKWWDALIEEDKKAVMDLPNFDKDIFKDCTGIIVEQ